MTFKEIYSRILPLWGETIQFSDAMVVEPKKPYSSQKSVVKAKEHFYSQMFSNQWNAVEEAIDPDDSYGELMVWTMYQVFQEQARREFERNKSSFSPKEIDKKVIEEQYFRNLQDDGWEQELSNYERVVE